MFGRWMRPLCNTGPQDFEGNPNGTATAVTSFVCGLKDELQRRRGPTRNALIGSDPPPALLK